MSNPQSPDPDEFALERTLLPLFRSQCIIAAGDTPFDPKGFNLKAVSGRSYKIFEPVSSDEKDTLASRFDIITDVIYPHMLAVRLDALDVIGDEYLFIRGYRVGCTAQGDSLIVIVETRVWGGCHLIDDGGRIGGEGQGHWYGVLCPPEAE